MLVIGQLYIVMCYRLKSLQHTKSWTDYVMNLPWHCNTSCRLTDLIWSRLVLSGLIGSGPVGSGCLILVKTFLALHLDHKMHQYHVTIQCAKYAPKRFMHVFLSLSFIVFFSVDDFVSYKMSCSQFCFKTCNGGHLFT